MAGVQLGKVLLIAGVVEAVGIAANAVASVVTDKASGALRWILPLVIAIGAAMIKALIDAAGKDPPPPPPPPPYHRYPGRIPGPPPSVRRRGTPAVVAVLAVLALCGGGGLVLAGGVRYGIGWITGNEAGTDRLVQAASGRAGSLTLTVRHVFYTTHFTRVDLLAHNAGQESVALPVFGNCVFSGDEGTTLAADPQRSNWSTTVPPGGNQSGTVVFTGKLPDGVRAASLSFSQVFVLGGGAITVRGIALRPG
jgi:hypothetical protein